MSNSKVNGTQNDMNSTSLAQVHNTHYKHFFWCDGKGGGRGFGRKGKGERTNSRSGFLRLLNFKLFGVKLANERYHGRVHRTRNSSRVRYIYINLYCVLYMLKIMLTVSISSSSSCSLATSFVMQFIYLFVCFILSCSKTFCWIETHCAIHCHRKLDNKNDAFHYIRTRRKMCKRRWVVERYMSRWMDGWMDEWKGREIDTEKDVHFVLIKGLLILR